MRYFTDDEGKDTPLDFHHEEPETPREIIIRANLVTLLSVVAIEVVFTVGLLVFLFNHFGG